MLKALCCCGLFIKQPSRIPVTTALLSLRSFATSRRFISCSTMNSISCNNARSRSSATAVHSAAAVDPLWLAQEWSTQIMAVDAKTGNENDSSLSSSSSSSVDGKELYNKRQVIQAMQNSLPLLEDAGSVPFVCRYRTDVISPLSTLQIALLYTLKQKHDSLAPLRTKLLECIAINPTLRNGAKQNDNNDTLVELQRRVQTTTSKSELQDLYAPYKPPSKGSILERIQNEHPSLVETVNALWNGSTMAPVQKNKEQLQPRDALVHLLATKIAGEPAIVDVVMEELTKHCRIQTTTMGSNGGRGPAAAADTNDADNQNAKFRNYKDFTCRLVQLKDHQVLAIRRGLQQKAIRVGYNVDGTRIQKTIQWKLKQIRPWVVRWNNNGVIMEDAIQDAWSRLLRRRGTSRLWSEKCREAEERAMQVFEDNLKHALLAPPLTQSSHVLALDPGYKAGIKCAILDPDGNVLRLETIHYLGNKRESGMKQLSDLLGSVRRHMTDGTDEKVIVALGNGHGSQEGRALLEETAKQAAITVEIHLVNEAGASVWSVTPIAQEEFPDQPPAAIAAVSIGRRLQNPLHDLVKVPPKSLGLGMYQHDLSEKELDEKLHLASVDAVATVGVDLNACSLSILQKVPGLAKLAPKIVKARPLSQRHDLLNVSGLGPKTYENCAAFCRVEQGSEPLDATLVHPESYDMARWLLKQFSWNLSTPPTVLPPRREWGEAWKSILAEASDQFGVSFERALAVTENLVDSMSGIDPRLRDQEDKVTDSIGSLEGCVLLSPELAESAAALQGKCPVRGIVGTIRNIADFGAFVDFGGHSDGLLHTSCLGQVNLYSMLIGQQVGVDILSVEDGRVSLGLTGLGLTADRRAMQSVTGKAYSQRRNHSTSSRNVGGKFNRTKQSVTRKAAFPARASSRNKRRRTTR